MAVADGEIYAIDSADIGRENTCQAFREDGFCHTADYTGARFLKIVTSVTSTAMP
jgi:hypothetical protein